MASTLPVNEAFALCAAACDIHENGPCTSIRQLDFLMHDRWHHCIEGVEALAKTLRYQWNMSTSPPLRTGNNQIFIYVPACLRTIGAAFSFANATEQAVTALFADEKARGLACPELPCKIRIDERLNNGGCGSDDCSARMMQVQGWLRAIEQGQHPGQGPDSLLPVNYQPRGPEAVRYFDIPYLDQRCYYAAQIGHSQDSSFSVATVIEATPQQGSFTTGSLVFAEHYAISNFLALSSGSEQHRPSPNQLFKLSAGPPGAWSVSFFGNYALSPALRSRARDISEGQTKAGFKAPHLVTTQEILPDKAKGKTKTKKGSIGAIIEAKNGAELVNATGNFATKKFKKWGKSALVDILS